jgi:integrase
LTEESKNLTEVTRQETAPREGTTQTADIKGSLTIYGAKQLTMGLKEKTVKSRLSVLELLHRRGANLLDPLSVFKAIDKAKKFNPKEKTLTEEDWSDGSKYQATDAYLKFSEILKIPIPQDVNFRKFKPDQKLPILPLETEIDQLIAGCSRKVASFLQLLKETGARCGEAWALKWDDIDIERGIVTFNKPEKHARARQAKMSSKLTAMLNMLPRNTDRVWGTAHQLNYLRQNFMNQRKRIASKLQNQRIAKITFHTFRHFHGTMEYHKTKDLLHVQQRLGHRSIMSTMLYTQLVNFESDDYHVKIAKNIKEDEELISAGFEYVTEREGAKIYRKRK